MLLDSNILIYGGKGEYPRLDVILDRLDLAVASVTLVETLGLRVESPTPGKSTVRAARCLN